MNSQGPRRWIEQRWLIDSAIRTEGVEWDQPRIGFTMRPAGIEANFDFASVRNRVRKYSDITPAFRELAQRRERLAHRAEAQGFAVTARDHYFVAALLYVSAAWPIFEHNAELRDLENRKNECYAAWSRLAPHRVERVEIPFGDGVIPAWFHLPAGWNGEQLPVVLACGGMDAFKEINVAMYGDKLLERGFAVLAFDGPGQGEALVNGITTTASNWIDAGKAIVDWAVAREEIDSDRMMGFGISFGSFWMTQIAATQPRLRGCVVSMVCHEPAATTLFERATPTFKARFMWMAGIESEEEFDRFAQGLDLRELVEGMQVPWLVIAGEADELAPIEHSYDLAARASSPTPLLVYQGERHSLQALDATFGASASALGPNWYTYAADWLLDRAAGVPVAETFQYVTSNGTVEERVHPKLDPAFGEGVRP
jgi:alpha-beta hydrolase superfamily lysophospholipase